MSEPLRSAVLALILVAVACRTSVPNASAPWKPGEIQSAFAASHGPEHSSDLAACAEERGSGVTEIAIERTPCYGLCSAYTLRLFADGTVEYFGQSAVAKVGMRHGRLDPDYLKQLADAAIGIGYFDLQDGYTCIVTDNPTVYTSVTLRGKRKIGPRG